MEECRRHDWELIEYREPNFGTVWAYGRRCKICGRREGTTGDIPWIRLKEE
jgi:hypothetical protein